MSNENENSNMDSVEVKEPRKENRVVRSFKSVVTGSFLSRKRTLEFLPFLLFLSVMALVYIANGYYAEEKVRQLNKINNELKELRSEYIITKSDLMFVSKQSEVAVAAAPLGIKESVVPPKKIVVKINKQTTHSD